MAESSNPTNDFLYIQAKVDSQEKLAAMQGKPANEFLRAPEFNKIPKAINLLRSLIQLTPGQIQQIIATGIGVYYGEIPDLVNYVNENPEDVPLGIEGTTFISYTTNNVAYIRVFVGEPGIYGLGKLQLSYDDLFLIYDASVPEIVSKPFRTVKMVLTLNDGVWIPFTLLEEEFQFVQIWGNGSMFIVKYFPSLVQNPIAFPAGTHVIYTPTIRGGQIKHYGHVFAYSGLEFYCNDYGTSEENSTMCIEISVPWPHEIPNTNPEIPTEP